MDITSRKNEKVGHFKKLAASREYRREHGEYLCDGAKLLEEAVRWGADIRDVLLFGETPLEIPGSAMVYRVTREVIEAASPMKTPQNVVFSVALPKKPERVELRGAVILEDLQDPGNVGTVLRTANAFGIGTVVLTGDCADVFSPKTVRASMGAVFRQRVAELTLEELRELGKETPIYGAALREDARDIRSVALQDAAVAIGNEGGGLSRALLDECAGSVIIPMRPACESLNAAVAASLIMWEMAKASL